MSFFKVIFALLLVDVVKGIDVDNFLKYVSYSTNSASEKCELHKNLFINATNSGDLWALQMIDASGFIPTALLKGNTMDLGFFDECVQIAEEVGTETIKGKYCYGGLIIPLNLDVSNTQGEDFYKFPTRQKYTIELGKLAHLRSDTGVDLPSFALTAVCIPHECFPTDIFDSLGIDNYCTVKEELHLDAGDISFLTFLAIILAAMCLGTAYDLYLKRHKTEPAHPILLAFSIYTNGKKIATTPIKSQDQISCLNGMKVLSLFWVIAGHRYGSFAAGFTINTSDALQWPKKWYAAYMTMAPLSVDTFLFVSGVLISYNFLKTMRKPHARFNILLYYLHRFLRITPALAVLYFFQVTIAKRLGSGPGWNIFSKRTTETCLNNWLAVFLYFQNYTTDLCLEHLWYLSMDMHVFLLSPLLLLPLVKYPVITKRYLIPLAILASILTPMIILFALGMEDSSGYNTHLRMAPWLIGLAFGAFFYEEQTKKKKLRINKYAVFVMWILTVTTILLLCWTSNATVSTRFLETLQKPVWSICLCWVTYACTYGYGGFLNWFLSCDTFQVLSKVSYSAYLVHMPWLMMSIARQRTLKYFDDISAVYLVCGDIFFSLLIGTFWTLAFESPMITIEKVIFGKALKPPQQKTVEETKVSQEPHSPDKAAASSTNIV